MFNPSSADGRFIVGGMLVIEFKSNSLMISYRPNKTTRCWDWKFDEYLMHALVVLPTKVTTLANTKHLT